MDQIVLLKLTTGEEVIATIVETAEDCHYVKNARRLTMQHTPQGSIVSMIPLLFGVSNPEGEFVLPQKTILMDLTSRMNADLRKAYYESTTGIKLVGNSLIK